jgi:hypothetical protein
MGDYHLLTDGGILDQPAALWIAARSARIIEQQFDDLSKFDAMADHTDEEFKAHERMLDLHRKYSAEAFGNA